MKNINLIPHDGRPLGEVRKAHFLKAFGLPAENMSIVSFGSCNFHCPYCKRDGQYIDQNGNIYTSREFDFSDVLKKIVNSENRIRLSGGDPCMFIQESLIIARTVYEQTGRKISIAHNGSSLAFIKQIAPFLEYAAIDLKASNANEFALRAGFNATNLGDKMLKSSLAVQTFLTVEKGILVDVRTCVFSDTTLDDLLEIAKLISLNNDINKVFWTIRGYNPVAGIDWKKPVHHSLLQMIDDVSSEFPYLKIGYRNKWEDSKFHYWNI